MTLPVCTTSQTHTAAVGSLVGPAFLQLPMSKSQDPYYLIRHDIEETVSLWLWGFRLFTFASFRAHRQGSMNGYRLPTFNSGYHDFTGSRLLTRRGDG